MTCQSKLQALLEVPLKLSPDKIAIRTQSSQVSYLELDLKVREVAAGLQQIGVRRGDCVAWLLPNCLEAVLITLACYQIGAIAIPLNYRYVFEEAQDVVQRTNPTLLVCHADRCDVIQRFSKIVPALIVCSVGGSDDLAIDFESLLTQGQIDQVVSVEPNQSALVLFTSGSTGKPKGVVYSHERLFNGIDASRQVFDFNASDIVLVGKPISHAGGLQTQLMPTLMVGGETVLIMKPPPADAIALIKAHAVTEYGLLASDLLDFIEYLEAHPIDLPSLRNCIGSGDSVPADLHHRFRDLFGWEVMEGAGMTEVGGYYAATPRYGTRKWGSIGLPTPGTELRIVDEQGNDLPDGQTGEVVLRMSSATEGYWNDPEATKALYRDGWLHTGDLARRDEDQYLWFVGRKKLMIVRRGSNIAPAEVENVLDEHPLVHASVVVGLTDAREGQIPVACVALLEDQCDSAEDQLRHYVAEHLATYKNPVHYLFLEELPRGGVGKFDRQRLQKMVERAFDDRSGPTPVSDP